eukprot:GFUD01011917.1.p1 GENE.GFUD01011917.1~~GFUD01011917.1.p1  ORF type:complete len:326 (+),score=106.17 GFUD01011917.1:73-1050(+)
MEIEEETERFEIIENEEINDAVEDDILSEKFKNQDNEIEDTIAKIAEDDAIDLNEKDIQEVVSELRHLEEKLHLWREVRQNTIVRLREIADYMDSVGKQTGVARVVGSGGGVLAGGLTLVGGIMTVLTAGAALPVLVAGAGLGLASGVTGGAAAITKKISSSKQMSKVKVAIEVDSAATNELVSELETLKKDTRVTKVAGLVFTVGGLASGTKGLLDVVRGATPGQTIVAGLETIGSIFGENVNKEIVKLVARTGGQVLSGTVTSVFGGVTMLWDMYQLRTGVKRLAQGGEEGAKQIRDISNQLEEGLNQFFLKNRNDLHWFNLM